MRIVRWVARHYWSVVATVFWVTLLVALMSAVVRYLNQSALIAASG